MPQQLPVDIMYGINLSLRLTDLASVAMVSRESNKFINSLLNSSNKRTDVQAYWTSLLTEVGLSQVNATAVVDSRTITDYKPLYKFLRVLPKNVIMSFQAWEIFCLSGSQNAIRYAAASDKGSLARLGYYGNALHCAARAGSIDSMYFIVETMGLPRQKRTLEGFHLSVLERAIESGSLDAIDYAHHIDYPIQGSDSGEYNLARVRAFQTDFPDVMRKICQTEGIKGNDNPLDIAIEAGSLVGIVYAVRELNLPITNEYTWRALDRAERSIQWPLRYSQQQAFNTIRLIRGLVYEQSQRLDIWGLPSGARIDALLSEPIDNILNSADYRKWTAPFQFKPHTMHPIVQVEDYKMKIKVGLVMGIIAIAIASILTFGLALPLYGICLFAGASYPLGLSLYSKLRIRSLTKSGLSQKPSSTIEQSLSAPPVSNESSYTTSLAPFIRNTNAHAPANNIPSQRAEYAETKRMGPRNEVKPEISQEVDNGRSWDTCYSPL